MKKISIFVAILALVALSAGAVHAANLLTNGDMDMGVPVEVVPGFFLPQPASWVNQGFKTFSGPYFDDLSSEPWAGPAPTPVTADNVLPPPDGCDGPDCGVFFKAFGGNVQTGDLANAILYQNNPATSGLTYVMTGWAGAEANYSGLIPASPTQTLFRLDFYDGANTLIGSNILDLPLAGLGVPNGQPFNYKQYTLTGVAPAGSATVRTSIAMLNGFSNPAGGGQAFVVDDFSLTTVPEPASIVLGLIAAAGVFGLARRKR
jgi:hypothetical protein